MAKKLKAAKIPPRKSSTQPEGEAEDRRPVSAPRRRGTFEDNDYGSGFEPRGAGGDSEEHIAER